MLIIRPDITAHRRGFGEITFLNSYFIYGEVHILATWCPCCSTFASRSGMSKIAHELRRSNRSVRDCGAQADFSVTPRVGLITVLRLEPQPLHFIPECSGVKVKGLEP